jgi:hypothetical protein
MCKKCGLTPENPTRIIKCPECGQMIEMRLVSSNALIVAPDHSLALSASKREAKPQDLHAVVSYALEIGLSAEEAIKFADHFEACGWRVGAGTGKPIRDWRAALRNWKRRAPMFAPPKTYAKRTEESAKETINEWLKNRKQR